MEITERQYDLINNEGGEGYNPIRAAREQVEFEAARAAPATVGDLLHRLDILSNTTDPITIAERAPRVAALQAQIAALRAAEEAAFVAEWTVDITRSRRMAWNAFVATLSANPHERNKAVWQQEARQGWTLAALRRAVTAHNLSGK